MCMCMYVCMYVCIQILVLIAESIRAFLVIHPIYNMVPLSIRADEYQPLPTDESEMNDIKLLECIQHQATKYILNDYQYK